MVLIPPTKPEDHAVALHEYGFTIVPHAYTHLMPAIADTIRESMSYPDGNLPMERITRFNVLANAPWTTEVIARGPIYEILRAVGALHLVQDEVNVFVGDSVWHRDGAVVPEKAYRVALYCEPLTRNGGSLLLIPGSHRDQGYWTSDLLHYLNCESGGMAVWRRCAVEAMTQPGDAIIFNAGLVHGSLGGRLRRQVAWVFVGDPLSAEDRRRRTAFVLNRLTAGSVRFW